MTLCQANRFRTLPLTLLARRCQLSLQPAGWCQPAIASIRLEALDQCMALLKKPDKPAERYLFRGLAQPEAAADPAQGYDDSGFGKIMYDFHQMVPRNCKFIGNFIGRKNALGLGCQPHQGAEAKVGKFSQAHKFSQVSVKIAFAVYIK